MSQRLSREKNHFTGTACWKTVDGKLLFDTGEDGNPGEGWDAVRELAMPKTLFETFIAVVVFIVTLSLSLESNTRFCNFNGF